MLGIFTVRKWFSPGICCSGVNYIGVKYQLDTLIQCLSVSALSKNKKLLNLVSSSVNLECCSPHVQLRSRHIENELYLKLQENALISKLAIVIKYAVNSISYMYKLYIIRI